MNDLSTNSGSRGPLQGESSLKKLKRGVLLINLGSPASPEPREVGKYLREFLMDKFVINLPWLQRWLLVNIIIVPFRKYNSAHAYKKIWTSKGSPLVVYSLQTEELLHQKNTWASVKMAMRYGGPSISESLRFLKAEGVEDLLVFPLYPQYAESSTETAFACVQRELRRLRWQPSRLRWVTEFYDHPLFIGPVAERIRRVLDRDKSEHLLFSYHGLPEDHVQKFNPQGCFQSENCCAKLDEQNRKCYRAQCFATTRALVKELGLAPAQYSISFQSRLGRKPWIKPYTDEVLDKLARQGIAKVTVVCPSFVADCLETIEEIDMRERQRFLSAGGKEFKLVPCLNSDDDWIAALEKMIHEEFNRL